MMKMAREAAGSFRSIIVFSCLGTKVPTDETCYPFRKNKTVEKMKADGGEISPEFYQAASSSKRSTKGAL